MLKNLFLASSLLMICFGSLAMEQDIKVEKAEPPAQKSVKLPETLLLMPERWVVLSDKDEALYNPGFEPHTKYGEAGIAKIIVGHTVTGGNPVAALNEVRKEHMAKGWATIGYTICTGPLDECDAIGEEYVAYRCRPDDIVPATLKGHNARTCGLGLIGDFNKQGINKETIDKWSILFGELAHRYGFSSLKRDINIFAMSDLEPTRFPDSPGKNFMVVFNMIIVKANRHLELLRAQDREQE